MVIAAAIAVADGLFKWYAIGHLPEMKRDLFFIDFALHKNFGVAFNIEIPLTVVMALTILICLVLIHFAWQHWTLKPYQSAGALTIVAGALGNFVDRAVNGFTTDYIILFGTSAINLADVLILAGTAVVLWYTKDRTEQPS